MSQRRRERVFLVRMWNDAAMPASDWRGSVLEVGTDRRYYIAGPDEVAGHIASALLQADPPTPNESG